MPQTVFDVGDTITSRLKLGITPDGTTNVAVTVAKPDGSAQTVVGPVGPQNTDEWIAQWAANYTGGGDYVAVWTVTGTGAGVQAKVYPVRALPSANDDRPPWAPFLSDVADHVPRLTIDTVTPGSDLVLGTFTGATNPTDEQAQRLIDGAVAVVDGAVPGAVQAGMYPLARRVAALKAAVSVLRGYVRNPQDAALANDLERTANVELTRLMEANAAEPGEGSLLMPQWAFLEPPDHGDLNL